MTRREPIPFEGLIQGAVRPHPGESRSEALRRALTTIDAALGKHCKRLGTEHHGGPEVNIEPSDGRWDD